MSHPVLILPVFRKSLLRKEKISINFCFETSKHHVQTTHENSKVTSRAPQLTVALDILKLVLYFNSSIITNQIKDYLAINRRNFVEIQYGFYRHAFQIQIHYQLRWRVIKRVYTKKSRNCLEDVWWEHYDGRSLKLSHYMKLFTYSFVLNYRGAGVVVGGIANKKHKVESSQDFLKKSGCCF